jgi:hypothetical protein
MTMRIGALLIWAALMFSLSAGAQTPGAPLELEGKISLGSVSGRIDHLAIDLNGGGFSK